MKNRYEEMHSPRHVPGARALFRAALFALLALGLVLSASCSRPRIIALGLDAENVVVSDTREGAAKRPPEFSPGDEIHIRFDLVDYVVDTDGTIYIQEDLAMLDGEGDTVLAQPKIIDSRAIPTEDGAPLNVANNITLFENAVPGPYLVVLFVRDMVGGGTVSMEIPIEVVE
jgi:hypothetical protein